MSVMKTILSRNSFLWRRKRHLGTLPNQNQKEGEQRVYVDIFCCIIRKAGATLRAATAPVQLEAVFFFSSNKGNLISRWERQLLLTSVCVCVW